MPNTNIILSYPLLSYLHYFGLILNTVTLNSFMVKTQNMDELNLFGRAWLVEKLVNNHLLCHFDLFLLLLWFHLICSKLFAGLWLFVLILFIEKLFLNYIIWKIMHHSDIFRIKLWHSYKYIYFRLISIILTSHFFLFTLEFLFVGLKGPFFMLNWGYICKIWLM